MPERKRTTTLDWEDIRYFVALARHGSLSATSRALRVNHATVSRRVTSLEAKLGRSLFDRRADGYALTKEGKAVLDEAQAMDEAALSVLRRLDAGTELSGLVRLTAARVLAEGFVIDRLGALHERYPALDIEMLTEARVVSLARRQADIALRLGSPKDSDLVGRRAARIAFGLYASPGYRDTLKAGQPPDMIGFDEESDFIFEAGWLARQFPRARFAFRSNSQTSQAAAARRLWRGASSAISGRQGFRSGKGPAWSAPSGARCLASRAPRAFQGSAHQGSRRLSLRSVRA